MDIDIHNYQTAEGEDRPAQTLPLQEAINAAANSGGGRVVVPAGKWVTGTLWLHSNTELHLSPGAFLLGSKDPQDFPRRHAVEEGLVVSRRVGPRRLIGAWQAHNVTVSGRGTIDGRGGCLGLIQDEMGHEGRPQNLQFVDCQNVTVCDVHLHNAGSWCQLYMGCRDVLITGIRVWNHGAPTNDGLDVDGCNGVQIQHCFIDSHDDALVFKSTGPLPCRNILVSQCTLKSNCHGIKFGTESVGGFEHIAISQCSVSPSVCTHHRPPNTGCALECTDGGTMRFIRIDGLSVEGVYAPFFIKLGNRLDRRIPGEVQQPTGIIEDITLANIHGTSVGSFTPSITGYPNNPLRRICIRDSHLSFEGGLTREQILENVPENADAYPEINMFTKKDPQQRSLPAFGCYGRHIQDLQFSNINLFTRSPDARPATLFENVEGFRKIDSHSSNPVLPTEKS